MDMNVENKVKKAEMHIVVTRADGTVEDLGVVPATVGELKEDKLTLARRLKTLMRF